MTAVGRARRSGRRLLATMGPYVIALVAVAPVALLGIGRTLARAGEPALPLDDAFIHLQYARRLAEGHWFSYVPGEGYSSGATSLLWPVLLAPFFAAGVGGLDAIGVVWALGVLAHGAVTVETYRLATGLAGRMAGLFAAAMCVVFGAFAWFSLSGMETVPFAWLLLRAARRGAECCEAPSPSRWLRGEIAVLGLLAPLLRPEGVVGSLIGAVALWRTAGAGRRRALAALPLLGPLVMPTMHWLGSGRPTSATAMVKWLPLDPYLDAAAVVAAVERNVHLLLVSLLQGGPWTAIFLPRGFGLAVMAGALAMVLLGWRRARRWVAAAGVCALRPRTKVAFRVLFVALILAATLIPATYGTMLWNRVRYIWPFAPAWFVAVACLGCVVGSVAARIRPALGAVTPGLLGAVVAALAMKLPWATFDLAQSARAIARQQVELGRWAAVLPAAATIGVNDTGAIAYVSRRRTFDVVGLTTPGEARHWTAGAGSRFEHYERLGAERLPTHFIVYPHWMACPAVLGTELHRRTVRSQSILGGPTMVAYEARYDLLESGARPFTQGPYGELLDELDVADLESERAHELVLGATSAADNAVAVWPTRDGRVIADGGRFRRTEDRFGLAWPAETATVLVMRVTTPGPLQVTIDGRTVGSATAVEGSGSSPAATPRWSELALEVPPLGAATGARRQVVVAPAAAGEFASFHYWLFRR